MKKDLSDLQYSALFKDYGIDRISVLLKPLHYQIKIFSCDEIIFTAGEPADTLGIILSGLVDIRKEFYSGKSLVVTSRGPGELLADAAMFAEENQSYPGTLFACRDSRILLLPKKELQRLFLTDPQILFNFLCSVSRRMMSLNQKIELLALNSIQSKIAHYLLKASETTHSLLIELPFSKKAWGEYLNVSRTSLSRELREMEKKNILSFSQRNIRILSHDALRRLLQN